MVLMKKITVLVLSAPEDPQLSLLSELGETCDVVVGDSIESFENVTADGDVILQWSGSLSLLQEVFSMCSRVRWVHSRSVGLERTLFPGLISSEVLLTNGRGVFSASLGEFALAAILYFAKDLRRMIRNQMAGVWEPFDITPVSGQTVGIVGYGDIGRAVAARVRPMDMNVLALKRHTASSQSDPLIDTMFSPDRKIEMISRCDYIVVATPLNAETRGLIGHAEFAAMKSTAVVINLGRGPVIDEDAMLKALTAPTIKGAVLDVFDEEPLPSGHPFYRLENVLLSPHCADHTPDWLDNAMHFFLEQCRRFRRGETLLNIVDKRLGY